MEKKIRKTICEFARLIYEKELVDSCGGNISVRDKDCIYIVPRKSGAKHRWSIEEDTIIVTDLCMKPLMGGVENISRESPTHYYIYQNFPDINAVIHGHPLYMMVYGAAHMDIPPITECMRARVGDMPITNIDECLPGSIEQAEKVVENFKHRRNLNPDAPLICNLPFHGAFCAGVDLDEAFMYLEIANNCAKLLIFRQLMFANDPEADFKIRKTFTKEEDATVEQVKKVCSPGTSYRDASGKEVIYDKEGPVTSDEKQAFIERITAEVLKQMKKRQT
jgi:L-ribulose-5-phosphate 4-epimerase